MKVLAIIGGSYAGVQAAISARDNGFEGRVILFSADKELPYHRPTLSKSYLLQAVDPASLLLRAESFFASKNIELVLGEPVSELDVMARRLVTSTGRSVDYDDVVLATGAANIMLPWQLAAQDKLGLHSLRHLDDAQKIKTAMATAKKAVVVGGGFIGLELASSFVQAGIETVLVERGSGLVQRVFSTFLSNYVDQQQTEQGLIIRYDTEVETLGYTADGTAISSVKLTTGERLEADLVVVGVGARPNTALLQHSGLDLTGGITVDAYGRTAIAHLYAAGDCAQLNVVIDSQQNQLMRLESVHAANELGKAVGASVAGVQKPFVSAPWFWSDQCGLKFQMVGIALPTDRIVVRGDVATKKFSVFHLRANGEVAAVQSVNRPAEHMLARRIVEARVKMEPALLEDESVNLKEWLNKKPT